jgi:hypothetical protein
MNINATYQTSGVNFVNIVGDGSEIVFSYIDGDGNLRVGKKYFDSTDNILATSAGIIS